MKHYPPDLPASLDFQLVLEQVRKYCSTSRGAARIMASGAISSEPELLAELQRVNEWLGLYQSSSGSPSIPNADITDCFPSLKVRNSCLKEEQFLTIKSLVEGFNDLHRFFSGKTDLTPLLSREVTSLPAKPDIPEAIDKVLDRHGVVRTNASNGLARIRSELSKKRTAADRIFYRALQKYQSRGVLGDITESVQGSRRVLAVQAAFKGQVNGIFHGSSSRNSLIYVEPAECIEVNNEVALLEDDERKEIYRILLELTNRLGSHLDWLLSCDSLMTQLDSVRARAAHAFSTDACLPQIVKTATLDLIDAYNPVLKQLNDQRGKPTVPLSLQLTRDRRILVISGPNAGGKSITLKTLGLLQMMLQSGFLIPVNPRSEVCLFQDIFGDIGDSQSIENELSTYSSRLQKMKRFLELARPRTLFLIDEFGSGSDPDLGSALAEVFLEELAASKAFGIITTHYNSIKALASELNGVENASMDFNQKTFQPEFTLTVGQPGSSYTFEVAQRSGLPAELVKRAKAKVNRGTLEIDRLLVKIRREKQSQTETSKQLTEQQAMVKKLRQEQDKVRSELEEKLKKQAELNASSSHFLGWGKKFESLAGQWKRARSQKEKKEVVDQIILAMAERLKEVRKQEKKVQKKEQLAENKRTRQLMSVTIREGDRVKLLGSRQIGIVQSVRKDKYQVLFGQILSTVERSRLAKVDAQGRVIEKED